MSEIHYSRAHRPRAVNLAADVPDEPQTTKRHKTTANHLAFRRRIAKRRRANGRKMKRRHGKILSDPQENYFRENPKITVLGT